MTIVPFKTPVDYYRVALQEGKIPFEDLFEVIMENEEFRRSDRDLHVYPYTHAVPAMLSAGCRQKCPFCPTAEFFKGTRVHGDYNAILDKYKAAGITAIHFMDEDFFDEDDERIDGILAKLKDTGIVWLCMSAYKNIKKVVLRHGWEYLKACGAVCIETGLENVALYKKVGSFPLTNPHVQILYLNMSFLPGETINTMQANSHWMSQEGRSLENAIHEGNGIWYAPGQYYHPYGKEEEGKMTSSPVARTMPSFVPQSLLDCDFEITDLESANFYSKLVNGFKMFPKEKVYNVDEFIFKDSVPIDDGMRRPDYQRAAWLAVAARSLRIKQL